MKETKLDSGYAWVILCVCFFNNVIVGFIFTGPIVFMIEWSQYYQTEKIKIAFIGSVFASVTLITGASIGPLTKRFGCRFIAYLGTSFVVVGHIISTFSTSVWWLIIFYGVVSGIGEGLIFNPPLLMIQYYFDKKRPMAAGIALMGRSVASFVIPLVTLLIGIYGWRGTLLLYAGIAMQVYVLGSLYIMPNIPELLKRQPKLTENKQLQGKSCAEALFNGMKHMWNLKLLKHIVFLQFLLSIFLAEIANDYMFRFTPFKAVQEDGLSKVEASFIPFTAAITVTAGRLISSFIANYPGINRTMMIGIALILQGACLIACSFTWNFETLLTFVGIFGALYGSYSAIETTAVVDLFGKANLADAQSFRNFAVGLAFMLSMTLAGMFVDVTGNYDLPNYIYGPLQMCAGVLMLTLPLTKRYTKTMLSSTNDVEMVETQASSLMTPFEQEQCIK